MNFNWHFPYIKDNRRLVFEVWNYNAEQEFLVFNQASAIIGKTQYSARLLQLSEDHCTSQFQAIAESSRHRCATGFGGVDSPSHRAWVSGGTGFQVRLSVPSSTPRLVHHKPS